MADPIKYVRLTRGRSRFSVAILSRASLWLGPDHLLYVESNGYTETYKRFYFRDIQAFILVRTTLARTINILLSVLTLLFLFFGGVMANNDEGLRIFLLTAGGVCGVILLIHAIPGSSCKCLIRTAVQTEELSSLSRLKRTGKVLDRIRPLITASQGGALAPEGIPNLVHERVSEPGRSPTPKATGGDSSYMPPGTE